MKKDEEFTNRALARLLTEYGIPADYEKRIGRRRLDIVADVEGLRVVLEAETGFHRKAQAVRDADDRIIQDLATVVFAVCYPEDVNEDNLAESQLTWTLRTMYNQPIGLWAIGSVEQLARAVQQAPYSLNGADEAAKILSDGLDVMVQRLRTSTRRSLARTLDLPATRPGGKREQEKNGYFVAAKRAMLVVATAMLFHHRVQAYLPPNPPTGYDGSWPPATASHCIEQTDPIGAFREAWNGILAIDYRPVFETGCAALAELSIDLDTVQALRTLANVVAQVSGMVAGLRHDLLGRIFHRVLDTARYDGSFYTSTPAAILLASFALHKELLPWTNPNFVANFRICDPACGTGTLLMAAAERIRDLRRQSDPDDEAALGLAILEDVLWGYDVNLTATHMAAATLGMLSPSASFSRINIHQTTLGVSKGRACLGSLDFLDGRPLLTGWPRAETKQVENGLDNGNKPPPMDLVIMNPPFTRDSLRHDQFSPDDEKAIKQREKDILKGQPYRGAARLHSSGGAFTVLAEKMLKPERGTLALVLPSVVPTAPGNQELRKYLAERFHIHIIVTSHDPQRISFSENTSIGEILLIARRWNRDEPKPPTTVINLAVNPATPVDALDAFSRIERAHITGLDLSNICTFHRVSSDRIARGDWFAVNFLSPFLVEAYRTLTEKAPFSVQPTTLDEIADIGPAGQRIRDAYTTSIMPTDSARRALWHHKTDVTQSMKAETDVYLVPKPSRRNLADKYWEQRSNLLLPHRLWLPLARVASVMLDEHAVGSIWTPCRPKNPDLAKAICLYLNSTPGLLSLLGGRDNRKPSYPSFSLDTLRSLPIPDFSALGEAELNLMNGWFDWLQGQPLQPFPYIHEDPVRHQIDDAVVKALDLDEDWIATIRRELAREPSVTDRRN